MSRILSLLFVFILASIPAIPVQAQRLESSNFAIIDGTVSATGGVAESANYSGLVSISPFADSRITSGNYAMGSGFPNGIQANVPTIRCFETNTDDAGGGPVNTSCTDPALTAATGGSDSIAGNGMIGVCGAPGCYNKAKIEINRQQNPSDTLYLVALSTDNFANVTNTRYLLNDRSLTSTLAFSNYMTLCDLQGYDANNTNCDNSGDSGWNSSKQEYNITGLQSGVTWYIKVRAMSGDFTETQFSPVSNIATEMPSIAFDLDTAATNTESSLPYTVNLGSLTSSVASGNRFIWTDLDTNAFSGASIYIASANQALDSTSSSIPSETEDLAISDGDGGYGAQSVSVNTTSVGPLQVASAFNLSTDNVRGLTSVAQQLYFTDTLSTNRGPISGGRGQLRIKARGDASLPAGSYQDTLTFTVSANW